MSDSRQRFEAWCEENSKYIQPADFFPWMEAAWQAAEAQVAKACEKAVAERDVLRADAARYRWLRDVSVPPHNFYISVPIEFDGVRYTPQDVDAAIDAAIDAARGTK
jgi:hypothetical protein